MSEIFQYTIPEFVSQMPKRDSKIFYQTLQETLEDLRASSATPFKKSSGRFLKMLQ
jgi:hypothetical protein